MRPSVRGWRKRKSASAIAPRTAAVRPFMLGQIVPDLATVSNISAIEDGR
jgi:hypothetical protein